MLAEGKISNSLRRDEGIWREIFRGHCARECVFIEAGLINGPIVGLKHEHTVWLHGSNVGQHDEVVRLVDEVQHHRDPTGDRSGGRLRFGMPATLGPAQAVAASQANI